MRRCAKRGSGEMVNRQVKHDAERRDEVPNRCSRRHCDTVTWIRNRSRLEHKSIAIHVMSEPSEPRRGQLQLDGYRHYVILAKVRKLR